MIKLIIQINFIYTFIILINFIHNIYMNTYTNILFFLIITAIYFILAKPKLTLNALSDDESYKIYTKSSQLMLTIYFVVVILIQFGLNSVAIVQKCGGSVSQNMGIAAMVTFIPWFFFLGLIIVALLVFPGWKSAFSDVIGYFFVANAANKLLSNLLIDTSINNELDKMNNGSLDRSIVPIATVVPYQQQDKQQQQQQLQGPGMFGGATKQEMEDAASAIVKLVGNMSILINQITPENFTKWWNTLKPLMKDKYQQMSDMSGELFTIKQQLLTLVVTRDNVGEAFWYIYTAILLISVVQLKVASHGCIKDVVEMKSNVSDLLEKNEKIAAAKPKITYT